MIDSRSIDVKFAVEKNWDWGRFFSRVLQFSSVDIIATMLSTDLRCKYCSYQTVLLEITGCHWHRAFSHFSFFTLNIIPLSRKERIRNVTVRQQIGLEETIVKGIEQNQLTWYGHVQRMAEGRLPKIALKWIPKQKRARGRPKKNWMEGIRKAMNERNLNEGQWEDRKQWSLGVGQRRKTF